LKHFFKSKINLKLVNDLNINLNKKKMIETIDLQTELEQLTAQLTGDMFQDMDIKDQIHNLEMKIKGIKPVDSHFDCVGCGS
jgi:hypothetical protein